MQLLNGQRHCYREISYLITSIHACKYNPLIFFFIRTIYYFSTSLLPFTPHLLYILSYSFHLYQRSQFLSFLFIFSCITSLPISRLLMINLSAPHPSLGFEGTFSRCFTSILDTLFFLAQTLCPYIKVIFFSFSFYS